MSLFQHRWRGFSAWIGTAIVVAAVAYVGWMCDDAYISMRVLDNAINGFGLRWNVLERVQVFTHPLWIGVLAPFYALFPDPYWVPMTVSLACVGASIWLILSKLKEPRNALALVFIALLSKAFVEYGTSGLETPLSYLLVVALAWQFKQLADKKADGSAIWWISALLVLNRLDFIALVAPALLVAWRIRPARRHALGALLLIGGWLAFATAYFGHPLPNSVLAKLNVGAPRLELLGMGFLYILDSLQRDPLTLACIALATGATWRCAGWTWARPLLLGSWLYIGGIVWAGGDFMSGRFFAVPFVAAIAVVAFSFEGGDRFPRRAVAAVGCIGVALSLLFRFPIPDRQLEPDLITDERAYYAGDRALPRVFAAVWSGLPAPWARPSQRRVSDHFSRALQVRREAETRGRQYIAFGAIGVFGFYAGPAVHIIDPYALSDPFLARLPAGCRPCRPGHYRRTFPAGFGDSVLNQSSLIPDPQLRSLWDDVRLISTGDLAAPERWAAIGHRLVP